MKSINSEHKRIYYFVIILWTLTINSCQTDSIAPEDLITVNPEAVKLFKSQINDEIPQLRDKLNAYNYSEYSANLENVSTDFTELEALINPSLIFLNSVGFSSDDLSSEFGSIEDPNVVILALATLISIEASSKQSTRGEIASDDENSLLKCVGSALGVREIWNIATGAAAASKQALLKAVGKLARRSMGWIGVALFVGEFVQCYWGNNSSFD